MPLQRESDIERKLVTYAHKNGILTYKFTSPAHRGVPDRIFICLGMVLFLEIKRPSQKPTALQEHTMITMEKAGAWVRWTDNYEDGERLLCTMRYAGKML